MTDRLSEKFILCPACDTWQHTKPSESVPEQSLRNCDSCESDFLIDYATEQLLDAPPEGE